jgi:hypothetical protein
MGQVELVVCRNLSTRPLSPRLESSAVRALKIAFNGCVSVTSWFSSSGYRAPRSESHFP